MEAIKEQQQACPVNSSGSKLRYPLRSATKSKDLKPAMPDPTISSTLRRATPASSVTKSMNVLDFSELNKPAKPPRRLSVPSNSPAGPRLASVGSKTPISETRSKKNTSQAKSDTPQSDVSRSTSRRKFSVLSSVSYWLSQIKLSESASKHSISLAFFKLALESGCEPLQRAREELKSYVLRHNLVTELGEPAKDLLQSYNILEDLEQLAISDTGSKIPKEGTQTSDEDGQSSPSVRSGNLKPKSLNSDVLAVTEPNKKDTVEKKLAVPKNSRSYNRKPADQMYYVREANPNSMDKRLRKSRNTEGINHNQKLKSSAKKPSAEKVDTFPTEEASQQDKENKEDQLMEESSFEEGIEAS